MKLKELLSKKRTAILKKWLNATLESYPADTAGFLKKQDNISANPAIHALSAGMDAIFNNLLCGTGSEKTSSCLDEIIRIRAVQDFTASQAVSFVFLLKRIIKEELSNDIQGNRNAADFSHELEELEATIDALSLLSFDIYMRCREKLYDIKANEMRNWTSRLVERANKIYDKHNHNRGETIKECGNGRTGEPELEAI